MKFWTRGEKAQSNNQSVSEHVPDDNDKEGVFSDDGKDGTYDEIENGKSFSEETAANSSTEGVDNTNSTLGDEEKKSCCGKVRSFLTFEGNKEALGVGIAMIPNGVILVAQAIFLSTALVNLARRKAGCPTELAEGETTLPECNNKVFGIRPSSILPIYLTLLGVITSFFMPIVGAMLDTSNYRRGAGMVTAAIMATLTFAQSFLSEKNWFFVLIAQVIAALAVTINTCVTYAYIPELTTCKKQLARFNAGISMFTNFSIVLYVVGMISAISILKCSDDEVMSARIAMVVVSIIQLICYGYAWTKLLGSRSARNPTNGDEENGGRCSLIRTVFKRVFQTMKQMFTEKSEIKWNLICRALTNSATLTVSASAISFMMDSLQISSRDIGVTMLIMLVAAILGNKVSSSVSNCFNPLITLKFACILWIGVVAAVSTLLTRPGQELRVFLIGIYWGFAMGWKDPTEKTLFSTLVPKGQEAEMMGLYSFASNIFTWFPPIIVTVMNEAGVNMRVAIATTAVYYLLGLLCLLAMGNYANLQVKMRSAEKDNHENTVIMR